MKSNREAFLSENLFGSVQQASVFGVGGGGGGAVEDVFGKRPSGSRLQLHLHLN